MRITQTDQVTTKRDSSRQLRLVPHTTCSTEFVDLLKCVDVSERVNTLEGEAADRPALALEAGRILFAPNLRFELNQFEQRFLSPEYLSAKSKNIGFNPATKELSGIAAEKADREGLAAMIGRFSDVAMGWMQTLCPEYGNQLTPGLASFRPAEISGRDSSWRKDDKRLHVDAFPTRPSQGRRILRLFVNASVSADRVWEVGEAFDRVAQKLLPRIRPPFPGSLSLLARLKITKGRRSLYDHYMLGLHDAMKGDLQYRSNTPRTRISFAPGAIWACFTDLVSHAALSGQFAFEQTFYLPVSAMCDPARSPLRILESLLGTSLI